MIAGTEPDPERTLAKGSSLLASIAQPDTSEIYPVDLDLSELADRAHDEPPATHHHPRRTHAAASASAPAVDPLPSITMMATDLAGSLDKPSSRPPPASAPSLVANDPSRSTAAPAIAVVQPPRWWAAALALCGVLILGALVVEWMAYEQRGSVWPF